MDSGFKVGGVLRMPVGSIIHDIDLWIGRVHHTRHGPLNLRIEINKEEDKKRVLYKDILSRLRVQSRGYKVDGGFKVEDVPGAA